MARYIDVETALKIIDNYAKTVTADGIVVVKAIRDIVEIITPTADVVPKSEIESIITLNSQLEAQVFEQRKEIERLTVELEAMRGAANSYKMHYEKAEAEVKRLRSILLQFTDIVHKWGAKNNIDTSEISLVPILQEEADGIIKKANQEFASEIFAEIDNILYKFSYPSLTAIGKINVMQAEGYHIRTRDYAELKKKYTEGEQ